MLFMSKIVKNSRDLRPEYCIPQTLFSEICKSRRLGLLLRRASRGLSMRTNCKLHPVKVQPLFPDFDRYKDQFVLANFDGAPTVDSEDYNKLDKTVRDAYESQAVMKNFEATSSNADKPGKFLAYMVPAPNEQSKDMYDENEDISYSKVREYHCDVRDDNADDPTTYLVAFGETEAHYMPVPSMLVLKKKGASVNDEGLLEPLCSTKIGVRVSVYSSVPDTTCRITGYVVVALYSIGAKKVKTECIQLMEMEDC
ncbi:Protein PAF1 -like protein [Capsicum baccatum]|uniref:Protein PAF1-like protein n=1 Tax=Capsicum baccatum TaxID=33114 RepID=A0A2G2W0P8_CAPBA|nr:Protein PAF1 -like protein [Capsicum baccatum]